MYVESVQKQVAYIFISCMPAAVDIVIGSWISGIFYCVIFHIWWWLGASVMILDQLLLMVWYAFYEFGVYGFYGKLCLLNLFSATLGFYPNNLILFHVG